MPVPVFIIQMIISRSGKHRFARRKASAHRGESSKTRKESAVLYSIAATAQANGVDTEQYLTELFSQPVGTIILPLNT